MKKLTRYYMCLIAAALVLALLCVSGCADDESMSAYEDDLFTYAEEYEGYYFDGILNISLELAKVLGDNWYREGDLPADGSELDSLLYYSVSAHTQDGRGVVVIHVPGSAGMSKEDIVLLTTKDYGITWVPSGGVYNLAGHISQISINKDHIYMVADSYTYGSSRVMMSEDFSGVFREYKTDKLMPKEHQKRMSELYNVYMRIVNVESDGEVVLGCYYYDGFSECPDSDRIYESSAADDKERIIMMLHYDESLSHVKTIYADESIF